jgi:hypothetical protein
VYRRRRPKNSPGSTPFQSAFSTLPASMSCRIVACASAPIPANGVPWRLRAVASSAATPACQKGRSLRDRVASCRSMKVMTPASEAPGALSGGMIWSHAAASVAASGSVRRRQRLSALPHARLVAAAATAAVSRNRRRPTA